MLAQMLTSIPLYYTQLGKWKTLKRKPKYGNGSTEVRIKAAYWWLVPCRQGVTVSKRCESQVLIHQTPASTNTVI